MQVYLKECYLPYIVYRIILAKTEKFLPFPLLIILYVLQYRLLLLQPKGIVRNPFFGYEGKNQ